MIKEFNECLLCSSGRLKKLKRFQHAHLVKCRDCSFVFSQKSPTEQELVEHYNNYGRNDYLSPVTIKRYEELLDEFEKYRKTNKILDVGCGIGYFLEVAKKRGWEVYGTEFTDKAIAICEQKGIRMKRSMEEYSEDQFDVITSFEVIEHINNPVEHVRELSPILRKNGVIYITTPNFNALLRYILKEKYKIISYPEHLSYYTPKTLNYLLKRENFSKKMVATTGFSITSLKATLYASEEKRISPVSEDEKLRTALEKNSFMSNIKKTINFLLSITKKGDSIKALYEKK